MARKLYASIILTFLYVPFAFKYRHTLPPVRLEFMTIIILYRNNGRYLVVYFRATTLPPITLNVFP